MELAFAIIIMIVLVVFVGYFSLKTEFISDTDFVSEAKELSAESSSTSRNQVQSQVVINDPNRTTSRLVGNGLAYFVFWFFGAPVLTLVVFFSFWQGLSIAFAFSFDILEKVRGDVWRLTCDV